jgi:hypothetical protein
MLPKNKLRNARLSRLKIFEDEHAGPFMRNVLRRYDSMVISPTIREKGSNEAIAETTNNVPSTKGKRIDDTPVVGSLGGLQPHVTYVPKVKRVKPKKKKTPPSVMKIFDAEGREWGRKRAEPSTSQIQT